MGCDIHAGVEVKNGSGWKALKFPNPWHGKWEDEPRETCRLRMDRNYDAFAILANVRNGHGFAGCDTGDGFVPIAMPRGFPPDITPEALDQACTGDHTPTYLTADEILAYDWTRKTRHRGWVTAVEFEKWDRLKEWRQRPDGCCGDVSGGGVKKITNAAMREIVKAIMGDKIGKERTAALEELERLHSSTYTQLEWEEPYTESAGDLWTEVVPLLMKLRKQYDDVRLVMNFDS